MVAAGFIVLQEVSYLCKGDKSTVGAERDRVKTLFLLAENPKV